MGQLLAIGAIAITGVIGDPPGMLRIELRVVICRFTILPEMQPVGFPTLWQHFG
jgi:hypothetical protein